MRASPGRADAARVGSRMGRAVLSAHTGALTALGEAVGLELRVAAMNPRVSLVIDDAGAPLGEEVHAVCERAARACMGRDDVDVALLSRLTPARANAAWRAAMPLPASPDAPRRASHGGEAPAGPVGPARPEGAE